MTKTDIGKFCSHCSKTVVDFTQLTDNDISKIIEKNSGRLCGRLTQQQLDRVLETNRPTNKSQLYKILAGLLLVGTSENLIAKERQNFKNEFVSITGRENPTTQLSETKTEPTTDSLKNLVKGMVIDSKTKEPLQFATILIKDTKTGTTTDFEGKFNLVIPDSLISDKIYLIIAYIGYERTEIVINKTDLPITKDLIIVPAEQAFLGLVETIVVEKKKWWQRKKKSCP